MHLYESHLGGHYIADEYEEPDYCGQCGDSDEYIGYFKDYKEIAIELFRRRATDDEIADVTGYELKILYLMR